MAAINDPILESLLLAAEETFPVQNQTSTSFQQSNPASGTTHVEAARTSPKMTLVFGTEGPTVCLFPQCTFSQDNVDTDEEARQKLVAHLLTLHHFVIEDVDKIVNLKKYFAEWKEKLSSKPLSHYCFSINTTGINTPPTRSYHRKKSDNEHVGETPSEPDLTPQQEGGSQEVVPYHFLSSELDEDKQLRCELWNKRLEVTIDIFLTERATKNFARKCIFCKQLVSGNRRNYFTHMQESHSSFFGDPDNIVFVNEFIDLLEQEVNALRCIYCKGTFKDMATLKEHMRKKNHRRIKSDDTRFDKFYTINYLEPGKNWNDILNETNEDENNEEEWAEPKYDLGKVRCLFCSEEDKDYFKILGHMTVRHQFDFERITDKMIYHDRVKLVNYIRRCGHRNICFVCESSFNDNSAVDKHLQIHADLFKTSDLHRIPFNHPEYFFGTFEDDQFLLNIPFPEWQGEDEMSIACGGVPVSEVENIGEKMQNLLQR